MTDLICLRDTYLYELEATPVLLGGAERGEGSYGVYR